MEILEDRQLLATIAAATSGNWLDGSTWIGGVAPGASDRALIGTGKTVTLDASTPTVARSIAAQEIVINGGVLKAGEGVAGSMKLSLITRWIHVNSMGTFQIGAAADRYGNNQFELTLTGTDITADWTIEMDMMGMTMSVNNNDGFLMTEMGGKLQFYGDEKLSFTKLAATVNAGSNQITVANVIERNFDGVTSAASDGSLATGSSLAWNVGDAIVIASSDYDYSHAEPRLITAITDLGNGNSQLTLQAALSNQHYGVIEKYKNNTLEIDMRAEVALLNRSIQIQGTQDTDTSFGNRAIYGTTSGKNLGIGGHTMIMPGSGTIMIDSVRFHKMGQTGQLGRYPIHWHVAGDRGDNGTNTVGDVLRNSSITNSNNRGVTIHGTHNLKIENNVLNDIHGHGIFMEDGVEHGNQFLSNIVMGNHKVGGVDSSTDPFIVDTHDTGQENIARFIHSSSYWITNPDNTWVGNVAAGSEGTGIWFALPAVAIGLSANDPQYSSVRPLTTNLGKFEFNSSHSAPIGLTFDRGSDIGPGGNNTHTPPTRPTIKGFTAYKHEGAAIYHRGINALFLDNRFADVNISTFNTFSQIVQGALYVGHSLGNANGSERKYVSGQKFYDGPGKVVNSHFAGYADANADMFTSQPGTNKHMHPTVTGLTFENDGSYGHVAIDWSGNEGSPHQYANALLDLDGSLTSDVGGGPGYTVVPPAPFMYDVGRGDYKPAGWDAWVSHDLYAEFRIESRGGITDGVTVPFAKITAPKGYSIQVNSRDLDYAHRMAVKLNTGGVYKVEFTEDLPGDVQIAGTKVPKEGYQLRLSTVQSVSTAVQGSTIIRVIGGALGGLAPDPTSSYTGNEVFNLTALRLATSTAFLRDYTGDLWVKMFDSSGFFEVNAYNKPLPTNPQSPYIPMIVNNGVRIEAENFDNGGQGFAYWDTTTGNAGSAYRTTDVDVQATTDVGGGFKVGFITNGEFLEYTADVVGGIYDIKVRVASNNANAKSVRLLVGNGDAAETFTELGVLSVPSTGGTENWQTLVLNDINLTPWQGTARVFRLEIIGGSFNINWFEFTSVQASIVGRQIFYNRSTSSVFGNGLGNPTAAIDSTKTALLPGQTASFANYTNYNRGLNGIVVDMASYSGSITAADFQFATWNGIAAAGFTATTAVPTITVIPNGGGVNTTRVKIAFPDNAIRNTWLRVTMLANANTGLAANDVFYFGNAIGDMNNGNVGTPITVRTNATDTSIVRQNQSISANSVGVTSIHDLNKDGRVNATDTSIVRQNQSASIIRFFDAPVSLLANTSTSLLDSDSSAPPVDQVKSSTSTGSLSSPFAVLLWDQKQYSPIASIAMTKADSMPVRWLAENDRLRSSESKGETKQDISTHLEQSIDDYFALLGKGLCS